MFHQASSTALLAELLPPKGLGPARADDINHLQAFRKQNLHESSLVKRQTVSAHHRDRAEFGGLLCLEQGSHTLCRVIHC